MKSPEKTKSVKNLNAWVDDEYEKVDTDPWGLDWRPTQQYRYSNVIDCINRNVDKDNLRIADIGCATGIFTNYIYQNCKDKCAEVVGVDISSIAIDRARVKYPDIEFVVSDIQKYSDDYKSTQDVVVCLETLYYIEPDKRTEAITQLVSTLRDNGFLVISSINSKAPYLNKDEILDLLKDYHLVDVSVINIKPLVKLEKIIIKIDKFMKMIGVNTDIIKNIFRLIFTQNVVGFICGALKKVAGEYTASHVLVIVQVKK